MIKRRAIFFMLVAIILIGAVSCKGGSGENESVSPLIAEGYEYNKDDDWYEKKDSSDNSITLNFTESDNYLSSTYVIGSSYDKVVFEGKEGEEYYGFSVFINGRSNDVTVEFKNFCYSAPKGKAGFDASSVTAEQAVNLIIDGTCKIVGGDGKNNGKNGESYNVKAGSKHPRNGIGGGDGDEGDDGIIANTIKITINVGGTLTVKGGNGKSGGNGGNGEGSDANGRPDAGQGGNGGNGGRGGNGIRIKNSLDISNNGVVSFYGGKGGNGGNAGDGGHATVIFETDEPDNGGNGGIGGFGGNGGYGLLRERDENSLTIRDGNASFYGGNGGDGGNGGNGGWSRKTIIHRTGLPGYGGIEGVGGVFGIGCPNDFESKYVKSQVGVSGKNGRRGENGQGDS